MSQPEQKENLVSRWSNFFTTRYKTTILVVLAITIAGFFGTFNNQRQDFPQIPSNIITVQATYIGASAEDVESNALVPLEQSLSALDGIKSMRTTARDNFGFTVLEMDDIEGVEEALAKTKELVDQTQIPSEIEVDVELIDVVGPTLVYALADGETPEGEMLAYAEAVSDELLQASNEIKKIEILPDNELEVRVEYDAEALNDAGLTGTQVTQTIQSSLTALPGGSLTQENNRELAITVKPAVESLEELRAIEIGDKRLEELATITRAATDSKLKNYAGFIKDGKAVSTEAIYLFVYKKNDGDVIRIAEALEAAEKSLYEDNVLPDTVTFAEIYDNSAYVSQQITDLVNNGILGLVLILLVLMLFINFRTGLVVALIIPLAFLGTLGVLFAIGFTINILTLFGLLLVLGILVDNAIVIAEGVTHEIEAGKSRAEAVASTMQNLGPAITAATATTVVVFIPFASIGGIIGAFLKYIPYTIIIMLVMSFFLAITITPVLARYLLKEETKAQRRAHSWKWWHFALILPAFIRGGQRFIDWLEELYVKISFGIQESKLKQVILVIGALSLIVGSVTWYGSKLPVEQFPSTDGEVINLEVDLPAGTPASERNAVLEESMAEMINVSEFKSYFFLDGQIWLVFNPIAERETGMSIYEIEDEISVITDDLNDRFADREITFDAAVVGTGPPEEPFDVVVEMKNDNLEQLERLATDLEGFVAEQSAIVEIQNSFTENQVSSIEVALSSEKLQNKNIDPLQAAGVVNGIFSEQVVGSLVIRDDGVSDDVVVAYSDESTSSLTELKETTVGVTAGLPPQAVELQEVAAVEEITKLDAIRRLDQARIGSIKVKVEEEAVPADLQTKIEEYLTAEKLAEFGMEEADIVYGGYTASQAENYDDLTLVFLLAMIAVYLILVYEFNSFIQPGLIMFTIPLALIGVFPGLLALGESVNMISGLGIVALIGIVVNDAIVFVDYYNRLRREHADWEIGRVLVETGRARFKPILSTSITTIFGVLPLTIADPFWRGLGASLITGLACSTIGTLLAFPILLRWSERAIGALSRLCKGCGNACKKALGRVEQ